jgi:dimethylamine monooxygenase subunit A
MSFDFTAAVSAPFRMQPGLRRLAPGALQSTPNTLDSQALREKLAVLQHHPSQALVTTPGFDPLPALHTLMQQACTEHPEAFAWDGDRAFEARQLGWSMRGDAVRGDGPPAIGDGLRALPDAWRLPGLISLALAEDFAVIDGATAHIPWLAVCLPSRWAPEDKVGRHFAQVHAPVADNAMLIAAGEHLARLVTGAERWERFVWSIASEPALMQHPKHAPPTAWPAALDADALAARAFFRSERQTFIPVPGAAQAVFTIHVESRPLAEAVNSAERARVVCEALASMSAAVLAYRGLTEARDRLLAWLAERTA